MSVIERRFDFASVVWERETDRKNNNEAIIRESQRVIAIRSKVRRAANIIENSVYRRSHKCSRSKLRFVVRAGVATLFRSLRSVAAPFCRDSLRFESSARTLSSSSCYRAVTHAQFIEGEKTFVKVSKYADKICKTGVDYIATTSPPYYRELKARKVRHTRIKKSPGIKRKYRANENSWPNLFHDVWLRKKYKKNKKQKKTAKYYNIFLRVIIHNSSHHDEIGDSVSGGFSRAFT